MEKNIDYLFNDVPLYTKEEFNVFELQNDIYELNKTEMSNFVKHIGIGKDKMITFCHKCKKEFPFFFFSSVSIFAEYYMVQN